MSVVVLDSFALAVAELDSSALAAEAEFVGVVIVVVVAVAVETVAAENAVAEGCVAEWWFGSSLDVDFVVLVPYLQLEEAVSPAELGDCWHSIVVVWI